MIDAETVQHIQGLLANPIAIVQVHARTEIDLDAAGVALLEAYVQVGANVASGSSRLAASP
jgi:hypothetical protein